MTCWVLVRLPATSYAFRHPTLARNMQGMPRMGRLAAATSSPFPCEAREKGLKTAAPSLPGQPEDPRLWRRAPNGAAIQGVESHPDGPPRMVKRPTGSGGEPSSPNCGASAGGKARQLISDNATGRVAQTLKPPHNRRGARVRRQLQSPGGPGRCQVPPLPRHRAGGNRRRSPMTRRRRPTSIKPSFTSMPVSTHSVRPAAWSASGPE